MMASCFLLWGHLTILGMDQELVLACKEEFS